MTLIPMVIETSARGERAARTVDDLLDRVRPPTS